MLSPVARGQRMPEGPELEGQVTLGYDCSRQEWMLQPPALMLITRVPSPGERGRWDDGAVVDRSERS